MTTALLARPAPRPTPPDAPTPTRWELDRNRCAVGIELALPGATVWRARLRPLAGQLTDTCLTANLSARPLLASLPGTRALFLRGTPRTARIWVEAEGELPTDTISQLAGEISVGSRSWPARFAVRLTPLANGRTLVTVSGRVVRPERGLGTQVRFEAVAEFVPCD